MSSDQQPSPDYGLRQECSDCGPVAPEFADAHDEHHAASPDYGLPVYRLDDRCATCGKVRFAHVPDPPDGYWPECATFTEAAVIDAAHLRRQRAWSQKTFGPGTRLGGILAHIRKELKEIEGSPGDVEEWVDVIILAFDGAWRAGWEPQQIIDAIRGKQAKNEARTWPDWREYDQDEAIEHVEPTTVFPPGSGDTR